MASKHEPLRHILRSLSEMGVIPRAAAALEASRQQALASAHAAILGEVPAYTNSGNPEILPGLELHCAQHLEEVQQIFENGRIGDFDFAKLYGHRIAEWRFPLEGALHAYRCGLRVLSHWLREATLSTRPKNLELATSAVDDFAFEYTNVVSSILTTEYVSHTRMIAETEGDRRTELMNLLLTGYDESDARIAQLLKRSGYLEQRQAYCVVVAQATKPQEMESLARSQRIVHAISEAIANTSIRTLTAVRNNLVTAVLTDKRRQSGWTAPQSNLADRVRSLLEVLGPAVLVGISGDHPSTSFVPKALSEATIALDFADVANRIQQFTALPVRKLLVHHGRDYLRATPPSWIETFHAANLKSGGALIETLQAVANADMNVQKAARVLRRHPNTVYTRLERICDLTSLDGQRYLDLTELLLAYDCYAI